MLSDRYQCFLNSLRESAGEYRDLPLRTPVMVTITQESDYDIDALCKPILDTLVQLGVLADDSNVLELRVSKYRTLREGITTLEITAEEIDF